ncbi:MAG: ACP S-malonyltransferase [Candidatus Kapaibacteriales bacterium]
MKTALIFPGQGSQYVGMMADLFENVPRAREIIERADSLLGYSLSKICFEGPIEELKQTKYTQPALFVHSAVVFELIKDKLAFDAVAGHSVGEYSALYSAGVLSFEDALLLVALRGELMFRAGEFAPGTMFAIIGANDSAVEKLCKDLTDKGNGNIIVPANYNCPGQLVVSGSAEYLRSNVLAFKDIGAKVIKELVVSGAFHSPLMEPARLELAKRIKSINFRTPQIPVYTNVDAKPHLDANELKELLIKQLTSPVLWTQTILNLTNDGIKRFIEVGAGNVLQGLVKRTTTEVELYGVDKFEDIAKLIW